AGSGSDAGDGSGSGSGKSGDASGANGSGSGSCAVAPSIDGSRDREIGLFSAAIGALAIFGKWRRRRRPQ
ncbi:MAG: hypothetical protein ACRELY_32005, partial [Polyangiaceae bacterium]